MNPLSSSDPFGIDRYLHPVTPSGSKRPSSDFSKEPGVSSQEVSETARRVARDYLRQIAVAQGACFPTEVHRSGVHICGIHHGPWDEESTSTCPDQRRIARGIEASVTAELRATFEGRKPQASPPKALVDLWNDFD